MECDCMALCINVLIKVWPGMKLHTINCSNKVDALKNPCFVKQNYALCSAAEMGFLHAIKKM